MTIVGIIGNERVQTRLASPERPDRLRADRASAAHAHQTGRPLARRRVRDAARRSVKPCASSIHSLPWPTSGHWSTSGTAACRGLREPAWLVMVFAALSALLAALGLYGVVSHTRRPATARNRHPHGAGRALGRGAVDGRAQRARHHRRRARDRPGRRRLPDARDAEPVVRGFGARSVSLRHRRYRDGRARADRRRRAARTPGNAGRSGAGAAGARADYANCSGVIRRRTSAPAPAPIANRIDAQGDLEAVGGQELGAGDRRQRRAEFDQAAVLQCAGVSTKANTARCRARATATT